MLARWACAATSGHLPDMPSGVKLGHETLMKPVRLSDLVATVEDLIGKPLVA